MLAALESCRRDFLDFARLVYPRFQTAPHHQAIAEKLHGIASGEIRRLILQVPPRHGKSTLASHLFPAWYLGRQPNNRIIACSYSVDLSYHLSRMARGVIGSREFGLLWPGVRLAADARAVGQWELAPPQRGGYVSAGVGGGITGKGAHLLIIDDPVKNAEEANSKTVLDAHWNWYTSTAYTRLEGEGAVILIMTRWAEDDLAGRLIAQSNQPGGDSWDVLNLPALAETGDELDRPLDAPLWPEKYDGPALERIAHTIGSRNFAALYQQRPAPAAGNVFKREWWQRYQAIDRSAASQVIQVWDTAFKAKTQSDYSVCATWARIGNRAYLLDLFRARMEYPDLKRAVKDQYYKYHPGLVLIEDRASGQSLLQDLASDSVLPVVGVSPDTDKVARANAVTPWIESGRVYVPEHAPWLSDFIEEHATFPNAAHDDQVDTTSMALHRLFGDTLFRPDDLDALALEDSADAELFT